MTSLKHVRDSAGSEQAQSSRDLSGECSVGLAAWRDRGPRPGCTREDAPPLAEAVHVSFPFPIPAPVLAACCLPRQPRRAVTRHARAPARPRARAPAGTTKLPRSSPGVQPRRTRPGARRSSSTSPTLQTRSLKSRCGRPGRELHASCGEATPRLCLPDAGHTRAGTRTRTAKATLWARSC